MAGAYRWKGTIQFGLLQFNVAAISAVKVTEFRFNKHHAACGGRLAQGGMVCTECGESNIEADDIVRGFGGVAGVDEAYLEDLAPEKDQVMPLERLVPFDQIDARLFQKSYNVTPDKGSEKQYVLFLKLLEDLGLVAMARVVMGGKEYPVVFRPRDTVLSMEVMHWPEDLIAPVEAFQAIDGVEISKKELALGRQLATAFIGDFQPDELKNELAVKLQTYLDGFVNGAQPPKITSSKPKKSPGAQSLEDALAASLAALPEKAAPARKRKAS